MSLSGSFYGSIHSGHYRLRVEWSAIQSEANNTSTITAKMYFENDNNWGIGYSATKYGSTTVDGDSESWSSTENASGDNLKILLATETFTVKHDSEGKKSLTISSWFDIKVTISGTYYQRINASDYITLDKIARKSTLTSDASWTAGSDKTLSISRASSSFNHEAEIYVKDRSGNWQWIKQVAFSTSQTSKSTSFSTSNKTEIFDRLDGRSSADTKIDLQTFNGSTHIGTNTYYGTVTAPSASTITGGTKDVYIDETIDLGITRHDSGFTHTVEVYIGSNDPSTSTLMKTFTGVGTSVSWTPTQTEMDTMYAETPNANEIDGNIRVFTYYNGELVRSFTNNDINFHVRNSDPIFSTSDISYADINPTTTLITGNDQYIVRNQSELRAFVDNAATAQNGASIDRYIITVNGIQKTITTTGYSTIGELDSNADVTLTVEVVDSRGNSTTASTNVTVIPYTKPSLNANAERTNKFESETTLSLSGGISTLRIDDVNKNSIQSMQYRTRIKDGTWNTWNDFTYSASGSTYSADDVVVTLDNLQTWEVEFRIIDELTNSTTIETVPIGKPIVFFDSDRSSVGIGKFPEINDGLEVLGDVLGANTIVEQGSSVNGEYVRWGNGVQMCWHIGEWDGDGSKGYELYRQLYPAEFIAYPQINISGYNNYNGVGNTGTAQTYAYGFTSDYNARVYFPDSTGVPVGSKAYFRMFAIGRWK
jgi:hypothetical protein